MTEFQLKIADYLITKYTKTGYVYKCIDTDAIKVFHDDGTETIYKVIDGVVTAVTSTDAPPQPTESHKTGDKTGELLK